jgi:hypothetical protein
MTEKISTIKAQKITAPRAYGGASIVYPGEIIKIPALATADYMNLTTLMQVSTSEGVGTPAFQNLKFGVAGNCLTIFPDGADLYVMFGPTQASVTGANAPVIATVGTKTAGGYTRAAGVCWHLPNLAGSSSGILGYRLHLEITGNPLSIASGNTAASGGGDLFMGYISSAATGTVQMYMSSPANP